MEEIPPSPSASIKTAKANKFHLVAHERGDVILVLKSFGQPFAIWDESQDRPSVIRTTSVNAKYSLSYLGEGPASLLHGPSEIESWSPWGGGKKATKAKKKQKAKKKRHDGVEPETEIELNPGIEFERPTESERATEYETYHRPTSEVETSTASAEQAEPVPETVDEIVSGSKPESQENPEIRMQVSSSHLIEASEYFKKMLDPRWQEGSDLQTKDPLEVSVDESMDAEALLILMNIVHGRTRQIPRSIDLEMLAKIAVLVDYYDCREAVEVFTDMWIKELECNIPTRYGRDLVLWLCISWVFNRNSSLGELAVIAFKQSKGPIQTWDLPMQYGLAGICLSYDEHCRY